MSYMNNSVEVDDRRISRLVFEHFRLRPDKHEVKVTTKAVGISEMNPSSDSNVPLLLWAD